MNIDMKIMTITPTAIAMVSALVALLSGEKGFALLFLTVGFVLQIVWLFLSFSNNLNNIKIKDRKETNKIEPLI